jgi:hypothetical protein
VTVRVVFRCERCRTVPDAATQRTLLGQLRKRRVAELLDAEPGGWLIWTAGGALGPRRYACAEHRQTLIDHLRTHYGTTHPGVRAAEPYPSLWPDALSSLDERDFAELLGGVTPGRAGASRPAS